MKIVHVINSLGIGGAEKRVLDAARVARQHGHHVSVVTLLPTVDLQKDLGAAGVEVFCLNVISPSDLVRACLVLARRLRNCPVDIVHTHLVQASLVGRIAAMLANHRAVVATQHNAFWPNENRPLHRLERQTWPLSRCIIALSGAIATYLRGRGYRRAIEVIPTGIDVDAFRRTRSTSSAKAALGIPPSSRVVGLVGALREQKGHRYAISAAALVARAFPGLQVLIAGEGPLREELIREATARSLGDTIHFLGPRADVPALMEAFDVFVLPSLWEGFGRVLIEAMAVGVPIVATDVEGVPEIVSDQSTGLLVPPRDSDRLAAAIVATLSDEDAAAQRTQRAHEDVPTRFSLARMVRAEEAVYMSLLIGPRPS